FNGPLVVDTKRKVFYFKKQVVQLKPKLYDLLAFLMPRYGECIANETILFNIWGPAHREDCQYLRVAVGELRMALEVVDPAVDILRCHPGIGYMLCDLESPTGYLSAAKLEERLAQQGPKERAA